MICLVSVVRFFCHHRLLQHRQGYWVVGFWNIIAFYSIAPGYWFLLVFRHHRFLRHRRGYWFCWFLDHHRLLQHSSGILVLFGFLSHHRFLRHSLRMLDLSFSIGIRLLFVMDFGFDYYDYSSITF